MWVCVCSVQCKKSPKKTRASTAAVKREWNGTLVWRLMLMLKSCALCSCVPSKINKRLKMIYRTLRWIQRRMAFLLPAFLLLLSFYFTLFFFPIFRCCLFLLYIVYDFTFHPSSLTQPFIGFFYFGWHLYFFSMPSGGGNATHISLCVLRVDCNFAHMHF